MCTVNNQFSKLLELRAKGHVLIPMFKSIVLRNGSFYSPFYPTFKWRKGWNYADSSTPSEDIPLNVEPFEEKKHITTQIHMGFEKKDVDGMGGIIVVVQVYADEITGCGISACRLDDACTSPRVFLEALPAKSDTPNESDESDESDESPQESKDAKKSKKAEAFS